MGSVPGGILKKEFARPQTQPRLTSEKVPKKMWVMLSCEGGVGGGVKPQRAMHLKTALAMGSLTLSLFRLDHRLDLRPVTKEALRRWIELPGARAPGRT